MTPAHDAYVSARAAQPVWDDMGIDGRVAVMHRFRALVERRAGDLAKIVTDETGKPIARASANDPQGFGLGIAQLYLPGIGPIWFYEGTTLGYRGVFAYYPKDDLVVAVTLNSQPPESTDAIGSLFEALYAAVMQ